jgi:hypothetical protein
MYLAPLGIALAVFTAPLSGAADTAQIPASREHIVRAGDTLWDLAFQFLGDPFFWPRIWRHNPAVRNPDLIYPGDLLVIERLGASESAHGASHKDIEVHSRTRGLLQRHSAASDSTVADSTEMHDFSSAFSQLAVDRRLGAEFLAKAPFLWTKRDAKGLAAPGNAEICPDDKHRMYQQFSEIPITIFAGDHGYAVGDTVDIYRLERYLKYRGRIANLVRRVGRAELRDIQQKTGRILLFDAWDMVRSKDRIAPVERVLPLTIDTVIAAETTVRGTVLERIDHTASPYPYQTFLIDRGVNDGVARGDIFLVYPGGRKRYSRQASMAALAVHVSPYSSTLTIAGMYDIDFQKNDAVSLVMRTGALK